MKRLVLFLLIFSALLLSACSVTNIQDAKDPDMLGETVTVQGEVQGSVKLGELSGYMLRDESGEIFISSNELPETGSKKRVSGEVKRIVLGIQYIDAKN